MVKYAEEYKCEISSTMAQPRQDTFGRERLQVLAQMGTSFHTHLQGHSTNQVSSSEIKVWVAIQ